MEDSMDFPSCQFDTLNDVFDLGGSSSYFDYCSYNSSPNCKNSEQAINNNNNKGIEFNEQNRYSSAVFSGQQTNSDAQPDPSYASHCSHNYSSFDLDFPPPALTFGGYPASHIYRRNSNNENSNSTVSNPNPKVQTILMKDEVNFFSKFINNSSSTLPTPPHSPLSSEYDLDNIIASFPEILEYHPSNLFPGVEDVLLDLENIKNGHQQQPQDTSRASSFLASPERSSVTALKPSVLSPPSSTLVSSSDRSFLEHQSSSPFILKDSMWSTGDFNPGKVVKTERVKMRTHSENSDTPQHHVPFMSLFDDEEYNNYLPDTPGVSDEDDRSDRLGVSPLHGEDGGAIGQTNGFVLLSPKSMVNREHNYCGKAPIPTTSSLLESDEEEVDVVSWFDCQKLRSSTSTTISSELSNINSKGSSEQVKRQLQMVIHQSMRTKAKRGRPSKVISIGVTPSTADSSHNVPSPSDVCGAKLKCVFPQGKPAAYTKRMREQHNEILKKSKRRKTYSSDPDDDNEKRSNHNNMERNRRVYIKNLFELLRTIVPETQNSERASKVLILKKAREYVSVLGRTESYVATEKENLARRNLYLKQKLQKLRIR